MPVKISGSPGFCTEVGTIEIARDYDLLSILASRVVGTQIDYYPAENLHTLFLLVNESEAIFITQDEPALIAQLRKDVFEALRTALNSGWGQ